MKHVVKYDVYLDILLMGSIYVIKSTFLRGNPISGQKQIFKSAAQCMLDYLELLGLQARFLTFSTIQLLLVLLMGIHLCNQIYIFERKPDFRSKTNL